MQMLISPRSDVPSSVVLATPPNNIKSTPRFTSSFPGGIEMEFSQALAKLPWPMSDSFLPELSKARDSVRIEVDIFDSQPTDNPECFLTLTVNSREERGA